MKDPRDIASMAELRAEIDAIDRSLVEILARRQRMIDRAIELKPGEGLPARIETRVEDVVTKVRSKASETGLDADVAEKLWRTMMEDFIAREERVLGSE
ncbi:chorismate mutase [Frigidibacter sp. MR17.14]|uniref:chorismate mutase n=1 Tax=Frigidibacter sp. MR17.14 TaxID=3126509 RepID=UPI0030130AED